MMFDDFFHEVNVQISVLMRQDVSDSALFAECFGLFRRDNVGRGQQRETIPAILGEPQFPLSDNMVGQGYCLFTRALNIRGDGVLLHKISFKRYVRRQLIVLPDLTDAPLYTFLLAQYDVIHTW